MTDLDAIRARARAAAGRPLLFLEGVFTDLQARCHAAEAERDAARADADRLARALSLVCCGPDHVPMDRAGDWQERAHDALAAHWEAP